MQDTEIGKKVTDLCCVYIPAHYRISGRNGNRTDVALDLSIPGSDFWSLYYLLSRVQYHCN